MFACAENIAGCARAYPVTDPVVRDTILDIVSTQDPYKNSRRARVCDLDSNFRVAYALNITGAQCHIVFTRIGGRAVTLLVYISSGSVYAIPVRCTDSKLHDLTVVAKATLCRHGRVLVVDSVCQDDAVNARGSRLDARSISSSIRPDALLFPLRILPRRTYAETELELMVSCVDSEPDRYHSASVIFSQGRTEARIPLARQRRTRSNKKRSDVK